MSPTGSKNAPEAKAREKIDALLVQAGWLVQDREDMNLTASDAIAVREFKLEKRHGYVDYLLFLDGWAKDRDPNTIQALEVEPLPFHGMSGYPYRSDEHFPDGPEHRAWRAEWNTRAARQWIVPLAPARESEWALAAPH